MDLKTIRKHVLKNAVTHKGSSQVGAIIPKLIGEDPKVKSNLKELTPKINKIVDEVNKLSLDEQKKELLKIDKNALDKKDETRKELPEIKDIIPGKCSFRLPPGPEKQLHAGHALSFLLNYYYTKRYKGKLVLRFEDTNPEKAKQEFVTGIREDLKALGITWDSEVFLSDNMNDYYKECDKLLKNEYAYACTCSSEIMKKNREDRKRCKCFENNKNENLRHWNKMKYGTYKEGECVIRLKGDMKNKNSTLWDPVIFRINKTKHYRQGNKYNAWPLYDFTASIEDSKITHVLRDANWTQRVELQNFIRKKLGIKNNPVNVLYSRYEVEGLVMQGREIREMVDKGEVTGYDDIRLGTIKSLLRRGILPETFMELLIELGISKSKREIPIEKLYTVNRRLLDKKVDHYFFVENPVELVVDNAPKNVVEVPLNPYSDKKRKIETNDTFYISKTDSKKGLIRLKHAYNVNITQITGDKLIGEYVEKETIKNVPIIQWVTKDNIEINIIEAAGNNLMDHKGYAEKIVDSLTVGTEVQFERFAFCKKEKKDWIFTHK